ncbi:chemotaxis-specific protein-glutamate methyltransferase CheB [Pseudoroseomonas globiformis]|uniref:protein-glutamate methylesterase n=1 Tax=Teichococcus globiformis TaxID=2307229 RepID=A0ABV7GA24_9PROT
MTGARPMRIGIVNAMPMAGEALRRTIATMAEHRVAWVTYGAAEAVRFCLNDRPDLVLVDLSPPGSDGIEATRRIMAEAPCAVLLLTPDVDANTSGVFEAMGHGAVDVVSMASAQDGTLLRKIEGIGRLVRERLCSTPGAGLARPASPSPHLVAVGASAGGPAALAALLQGLPENFPATIVIIQHVDERFAAGMAEWLDGQAPIPVSLARENEAPLPGRVLLAAGDQHLALRSSILLGYTPEPRDYVYRPSVDVFFHSVARLWKGAATGVLLTGMGRDGAEGLKALRQKGFHTIAQDRPTSAVYGMPKAAADIGAATEILPLSSIAPRLIRAVTGRRPEEAPT